MITGMPARRARSRADFIAAGLARVTMIPSTFLSMAAFTSCACCCASSSWEYRKLMLSFTAACSAPLWTMSQKVSPSPEWVIIAKVQRGVFTAAFPWADAALRASSARLPPVLLQPARDSDSAPASAMPTHVRNRATRPCPSCCAVLCVPGPAAARPGSGNHKRPIVRHGERASGAGERTSVTLSGHCDVPARRAAGHRRSPTGSRAGRVRSARAAGTRRSSGTAGRCGCRTRPRAPCRRRWCAPW